VRSGGQAMEFRILGPLEVVVGGRPLGLGGAKQRALLAILILHANQVVSADRLIDLLWGEEAPQTAANTLQVYISQLRKAIEPARRRRGPAEVLVRRPPGYVLQVGPDRIDAERFGQLVSRGQRELAAGRNETAAEALREGLDLWRGPALADFSYEPFAQNEITRLEELRMSALEDRIEADLALGRHASFIGELDALVAQYPLREGLRGNLMLALYRSGRQAEALQVYQDTRRALDEELGIDPSLSLQELEKGILMQDASLNLPSPPVAAPEGTEARCAECDAPVTSEGDLCENCAQRAAAEPLVVRKTVTILSCEMSLHSGGGELDPEALQPATARLGEGARSIVERHGATCATSFEDHVIALFGVPVLHEDDALRAVSAAMAMRGALGELAAELEPSWGLELEVRIGINTGDVIADAAAPPGTLPAGEAVNRAVRLGHASAPGDILLSQRTRHLTEDAVEVEEVDPGELTGVKWRPVFRLLSARPGAAGRRRRLDAPMVGRDFERAQLDHAYERATREQSCHLFTVLGPAGVGKSRLAVEVLADVQDRALILTGRCLPYGEGVTLSAVSEMVRGAASIDPRAPASDALERIAALLGGLRDRDRIIERLGQICGLAEGLGTVEETFWAVRKLFESLAGRRPVVAVFDDLHWAEPTLLDLIEHIADWLRGAPVLLVALARPELLEQRPSWAGGKLNASSTLLEPLSERECHQIVGNLLGQDPPDPEVSARIAAAAEGNPLYVEEMTRMLVDDGHLRLQDGRWVVATDLSTITIPPTIQALISARLDRLGPDERQVIDRAAIVGRMFSRRALLELSPDALRPRLGLHLETLMRKELIRPDRAEIEEDEAFRFRHMLIRDAAYAEMAKEQRADLHERLAAWLEAEGGEAAREETRGYHLERAVGYRRELRPADPSNDALGRRASTLLASAGHKAFSGGDLTAAANLLERSARLLPATDVGRLELMLDLSGCLMEIGALGAAEDTVARVADAAAALPDARLSARASMQLWELRSSSQNLAGWKEEALRDADQAVVVFQRLGDELGLAKALQLKAMIHQVDYEFARADAALEEALVHVRGADSQHEEVKINHAYTRSALFGPVHVAEALRRLQDFKDRFEGNRLVEADCLRNMAALVAMRGEFGTARELLAGSREILRDLGATLMSSTSLVPGMVELLAGDAAAAESCFRASYAALQRAGERSMRATAAAYVARALYAQGRYDEAERFTVTSEELAPPDDHAARVEWSSTRAKTLALSGRHEEAQSLASEAVALAARTDDVEARAHALLDRAEVLRLGERLDEAADHVRSAVELLEGKGNLVSAARARALLDGLSVASAR
jgi:DNA-binding SARP family transcriptional activator/class 3 adenylate cyclase